MAALVQPRRDLLAHHAPIEYFPLALRSQPVARGGRRLAQQRLLKAGAMLAHVSRMHRIDIAYAKRCLTADAAFRAQAPGQRRRRGLAPVSNAAQPPHLIVASGGWVFLHNLNDDQPSRGLSCERLCFPKD
jgi:hypothetical protein